MRYIHQRYTPACVLLLILCTTNFACKKQDDYLNALPDISLTIPKTLNDLQLMLQNDLAFNRVVPGLGLVETDEYYISDAYFQTLDVNGRNEYTWAKDLYPNTSVADWNDSYNSVYLANVVLDALPAINKTDDPKAKNIEGTALFFRAQAFYNLLQIFAMPYDSSNEAALPGIILRLSADLNAPAQRASMKDGYSRVIGDMKKAIGLLPSGTPVLTLPTKAAAYGYLARIYVAMNKYADAFQYADSCLALFNTITDFNKLSVNSRPIATTAPSEILYYSGMETYSASSVTQRQVDTVLYRMYDANDLRRAAYCYSYSGRTILYGSFEIKSSGDFSGVTTGEIYLIRAECYARQGKVTEAMQDLNALVINRYKTNTFTSLTATDADDALKKVLLERRKELVCRGLRWTDIRRLNKDPRFAITLTRIVNGQTYTLPPNDPRYALPIPDNEIQLSGIPQNQR